jgi:hypothetical protein
VLFITPTWLRKPIKNNLNYTTMNRMILVCS